DGELVDVVDSPPYAFSWEATAEHAGGDVTFTAVVTDSAGQETTSAALTVAVAEPAPEPTPGPTPGPSASPTPGPTPAPTAEPTPTEDAAPVTVPVRKVFLNRKRGTARLKVRTSGTGVLVLGGRKVVGVGK